MPRMTAERRCIRETAADEVVFRTLPTPPAMAAVIARRSMPA
jgi:hypothetical protein